MHCSAAQIVPQSQLRLLGMHVRREIEHAAADALLNALRIARERALADRTAA